MNVRRLIRSPRPVPAGDNDVHHPSSRSPCSQRPSLARPSGNITGVVFQQIELAAKRIQLIKDGFPDRLAATMFWDKLSADQWEAARSTAAKLGLQLSGIELREPPYDYEAALDQAPLDHRGILVSGWLATRVGGARTICCSAACLAEMTPAAERVPSPACSRRWTSLQISLKFSLRAIFSMPCPGRNRGGARGIPRELPAAGSSRHRQKIAAIPARAQAILPRSGTGPELRIANAQIKCE
jgi:hypothetical protein